MRQFLTLILFASFVFTSINSARSENWPGWRGPRSDGTSSEAGVPTKWDGTSGDNIVWKVPVPGVGHSSPIVWGDRVFVVSCLEEEKQRVLICFDRKSGKKVWQKTVVKSLLESKHALNSFASGTPATDGKLVYVTFLEANDELVDAKNVGNARKITPGVMVIAAYDFDGNQKWLVKPGDFVSCHGYCSCPVLYKDMVIVNGDHDGDSYIVALKKSNGETVWKTERDHKTRSYVTPLIREAAGRTQMFVSGDRCMCSYNPDTGERYWKIDGPTEQYVASPVFDGEKFYMAAGFPTHHVVGIKPDGNGNVTETHVAWHVTTAKCYVPSPALCGKYLLVADDRGTANCFDTATGDRFWQERLGTHYSASLVVANDLVYFTADDGVTKIVRPGEALDVAAENPLGENCYASPAISNGQILIRGERHLYCIGEVATGE